MKKWNNILLAGLALVAAASCNKTETPAAQPEESVGVPMTLTAALGGPETKMTMAEDGNALKADTLYNMVRARLSEIPTLGKRSPHVLRHSFATAMLTAGADLMAVKELMGHASLDSTEVYTHITPQEILSNYKQAHPRATNFKKKGD